MTRRGTSTVIIHRDGTITYWSVGRRVTVRCQPENIPSSDLDKLSKNDLDRLTSRFGVARAPGRCRLLAVGETK